MSTTEKSVCKTANVQAFVAEKALKNVQVKVNVNVNLGFISNVYIFAFRT